MRSRWAKPAEQPELQSLWERVFGDGKDVTDSFFRQFPPEQHTRVIWKDGGPASMASWIPVFLHMENRTFYGAYIYAVATAPEYRGNHFAGRLVEELENTLDADGLEFAALCPAEPSLYSYYGAMGYDKAFFCDHFRIAAGERLKEFSETGPEGYATEREALLGVPHCAWSPGAWSYLADTGTRFFRFEGGCAAVTVLPDGKLRIPELIADSAPSAAAELCSALGASGAEVFTPGIEYPRGMLKWFSFRQKNTPMYLGFAFD